MRPYALHPGAILDLDEIWEYIAADNPEAAHRVSEEVFSAIQEVCAFPHQGHRRPDLTSRPIRFIRVRSYLIAYVPDEVPVWVLAIFHGQRSQRVMAAILRERR